MIGLQARLTIAFLLLAGVVTGGTAFVLYERIHDQFRRDFEDGVVAAQRAVRDRLERDADSLRERVEGVAQRDPRIEELLQDLSHGRFDADSSRSKWLQESADGLRRGAGLDVLWIFDTQPRRRVLAAPHRMGDVTPTEALIGHLSRETAEHALITEPVVRGGRPVVVPVLEVVVRRGRLQIVGGRVVGRAVAEDLRIAAVGEIEVTIQDPEGDIVASTLEDAEAGPGVGYETARVIHRNPGDQTPALRISVHVSRTPMDRRVAGLLRDTGFVAGAAGVLALLLGWLLARRITRPVRQLVAATRQVAAGDRLVDLPAGRRDELGELMDAFATMLHELDESEHALRRAERVAAWQEIARELAHEIKNPLTPIQMAIETTRRAWKRNHPQFDEVFDESTHTILEEVNRLKTIVSEFSQFARMPRPNPHPCDLNDLIHQSVVLYRDTDGVTIDEELAPGVGERFVDPDRMTQVIQNLLKNAIQAAGAMERHGRVKVATRIMETGGVELSIEDNGCGIPAEDLPRVFTPYFTSKAGGTGLGLAVVHRIVTGHDGRIGVSSRVGEGTRFMVQLPPRRDDGSVRKA